MPLFFSSALRASLGAALRFRHLLRSAEICAARPHAYFAAWAPKTVRP